MAQYIRRESGVLLKEDEIIFLERDWHQKPSVELTNMPKSRRYGLEVNGYGLWVNGYGLEVNGYGAGWCTLDGRRLDGKPTAKGVYIRDGRKVIIK